MAAAADEAGAMRGKRAVFEVLQQADFAQFGDHQVHLARASPFRQFLPRRDDQLYLQPWMGAAELADHRPDQCRRTEWPDADAQLPEVQPPGQLQVALQVARTGNQRLGVAQQQAPDLGGFDGAALTLHQHRAGLRFERLDAARERRLGQVHRLGGAAEVAVLDDCEQVMQAPEIKHDAQDALMTKKECIGHMQA